MSFMEIGLIALAVLIIGAGVFTILRKKKKKDETDPNIYPMF
jgi:F0F1-type ATP synthase assembly protein I